MKKDKKKRSSKVLGFISSVVFKFKTPPLKHLSTSSCFTLIELITAMAIFTGLMVVMMRLFSESQQAWTKSSNRSMTYDDSRVAMDLMSRDLQSAFYSKDITPFANYASSDKIAFISASSLQQNDEATSPYSEVQYELGTGADNGYLMRSVTSNKLSVGVENPKYDYTDWATPNLGIFASREDSERVIPYVTELGFEMFKLNGSTITTNDINFTNFPGMVKIKITLLDRDSWKKWEQIVRGNAAITGGDGDARWANVMLDINQDKSPSKEFRENAQRTFTKMIFMGERGQ